MTVLYRRGPNVAMKRDFMRFEYLIKVHFKLIAFGQCYLSGITMHAHPDATKIAAKPSSRLAPSANMTSSIAFPIVNHGCRWPIDIRFYISPNGVVFTDVGTGSIKDRSQASYIALTNSVTRSINSTRLRFRIKLIGFSVRTELWVDTQVTRSLNSTRLRFRIKLIGFSLRTGP